MDKKDKKIIILDFFIVIIIITVLIMLGPLLIYLVKYVTYYYTHYPKIYIITTNISNSSKEVISNEINGIYQNLTLLVNNLTNNG